MATVIPAKLIWHQPELIGVASCVTTWQRLPTWVQAEIWDQLLAILSGEDVLAHDQPALRRLAERTFRSRVERAFGNDQLLRELADDCPFWPMHRQEILEQNPNELRQWHRLLRPPKGQPVPLPYLHFVRSLRHAAGLLESTRDSEP